MGKKTDKMADYNIDSLMKKCIIELVERFKKGESSSCEVLWYSMTRQMFKMYPARIVYGLMERALCEASNKQWFENKYPKEVFMEMSFEIEEERKRKRNPNPNGSGITAKITQRLSIIDLAKQFGLKVKHNKAVCPFHDDKDPSLSFSDDKGLFHCFGCGISGNIIKFYALMKKLK